MRVVNISTVIGWSGMVLFGIGIMDQIQIRKSLPPGVCPLEGHRQYFLFALIAVLASIMIENIEKRKVVK